MRNGKLLVISIFILLISASLSGCVRKTTQPAGKLEINPSLSSGEAPLTVYFSVNKPKEKSISSYHWDFGDGSFSSSPNPSHTYKTPGTYEVTLSVTYSDGTKDSANKIIYVKKSPEQHPPHVSISASPTNGVEPLKVSFISNAYDTDGTIVSYHWDFGDGETSTSPNPTHTYHVRGIVETQNYIATLTVTDNDGLASTDSVTITVLKDTDGDGIPDVNDIDDDNDGYKDVNDYFPKKNAKIEIILKSFKVIDEVDPPPDNLHAQVYFKIYIDDKYVATAPSSGFWDVYIGKLTTINWVYVFDCPDNKEKYKINIQMYDKDAIVDDLLDIDGHDSSYGLTITYDIVTGTWTGDDTTGRTNGSDDGSYYTDDNDAYLEYDIKTI